MNKFRKEIEITKIKRCDQKSAKKRNKKKNKGTLHNKFITLDELLAANSRGLGTAGQQIPSGPVFLCHTAPEKDSLSSSIHPVSSLPSGFSVSLP